MNIPAGGPIRGFGKLGEGTGSRSDRFFNMDGECRHGLRPELEFRLFYRK